MAQDFNAGLQVESVDLGETAISVPSAEALSYSHSSLLDESCHYSGRSWAKNALFRCEGRLFVTRTRDVKLVSRGALPSPQNAFHQRFCVAEIGDDHIRTYAKEPLVFPLIKLA